MSGMLELERTMPEDLFKLTVPAPTDDCYTLNGYIKKKCKYDKDLAELYKVERTSAVFQLYRDTILLLSVLRKLKGCSKL